jgi:hypothetical protein
VLILLGKAVEHHEVRRGAGHLVGVDLAVAEIGLGLHHQVFGVHRRETRRVDDDGSEHARSDVHRHRGGCAVIHPDPGVFGPESIDEFFARIDGAHRLVGPDHAGVEVDGMSHRAVVDQGDLEDVTQFSS